MADKKNTLARPSYIHSLMVRVPSDTKWQPLMAQRLMVALFSIYESVALQIRATADTLVWQVEAQGSLRPRIQRAIYGVYPQAEVTSARKTQADVGYFIYEMNGAAPFAGALKHATDFKDSDPLAGLLAAISNLGWGEEIVFNLTLHPPTKNYAKIGEKQLTKSGYRWLQFLSPRMTTEMMLYRALFDMGQVKKLSSDLHRVAESKLRMPLKEVAAVIKVKTANQGRADQLMGLLTPALATYARPGLNFLVPAQKGAYKLVLSAPEVAALWHLPTKDCMVSGIDWASDPSVPLPRELAQARYGVILGKGVYQGQETQVRLPDADRVTHMNIVGKTRMGKSTLMHNLIHQDIQAGHGVGVIDPHGDLVEAILERSIPPERAEDVVLFDIGEREKIIGLNLLDVPGGVAPEQAADMALAVLKKYFGEEWRSGRMEDTLYASLVSLMSVKDSVIQDIALLLNDGDFREKILEHVQDPVAVEYWKLVFDTSSPAQQRELTLPITTRMRKLYRTPTMRRILGQPYSLDIAAIMRSKKIFLVNLRGSGSSEEEVGNTLGALLISKIQMAAMSRTLDNGNLIPFYLYVDEVQNFVTTSLPIVLSEAATNGLYLCIANQFLAQLTGDTLQAVLGNVGTTVMFRSGPNDANMLAGLLRPHFSREHLEGLSRFKMIVRMQYQGVTLPAFIVHNHPPVKSPFRGQRQAADIKALSRKRYGMPAEKIDQAQKERFYSKTSVTPMTPKSSEEVDYFG